jgi:peptide deformylase
MAILPIIWAPDPVLKTKCKHVSSIDDEVKLLMENMLETMYDAPGVGLAAPQLGIKKRIIVVDCAGRDETPAPYRMINPELIALSEEEVINEEGCLSLPGHYADVSRPTEARVKYLDENGDQHTLDAEGLLAVCIQHEIDHINGILFVDHLSSLKRNMMLKKMVKAKKER